MSIQIPEPGSQPACPRCGRGPVASGSQPCGKCLASIHGEAPTTGGGPRA